MALFSHAGLPLTEPASAFYGIVDHSKPARQRCRSKRSARFRRCTSILAGLPQGIPDAPMIQKGVPVGPDQLAGRLPWSGVHRTPPISATRRDSPVRRLIASARPTLMEGLLPCAAFIVFE